MEKPTQISRVALTRVYKKEGQLDLIESQAGQTGPTLTIAQPNVRERQIDVPHDITLLYWDGEPSIRSPALPGTHPRCGCDPPLVLVSVSNTSGPVSVKLLDGSSERLLPP